MSRRTPFAATVIALPVLLGGCGLGTSIAGIHDAPAEQTGGASITTATATKVAERVVKDAVTADRGGDAAASKARDQVLSGPALREAEAAARTKDATTRTSRDVEQVKVLGVSSGTAWPRAVLATSRAKDVQYLHVLVAESADQPYTLFADVPMAAGASVPALAPLEEGSPVKMSSAPEQDVIAAATSWGKGVAFPTPKKAPKDVAVNDAFSTALRKNARATHKELGKLGTYTQSQAIAKGETLGFELADGGSITFLPMTRTDTFTANSKLKELKVGRSEGALKRALGKAKVTKSLTTTNVETLAFVVPDQGSAQVVGASEVLHSAKGR